MLNAEDTQFRLTEDGQINFQKVASNPMPGEPVAMLARGSDVLTPKVVLLESANQAGLQEHLQGWLARHIGSVLEPLVALEKTDEFKASVKGIAFQVHEALGIVPRAGLEDLIAELDADDRRDLRTLKIRLGPILVFIPALNKPAAVRLRALLWGLYNDKDLPMECPKDGIVSFALDGAAVDKSFYQAIAYPVYGGRAIRIDMLDRVISAVYDAAEGGKFKADHKMAEWLGCSIEGLYEVLGAMGHTKIHDPADVSEETAEVAADAPKGEAEKEAAPVEAKPVEGGAVAEEAKKGEDVKPELATFRLKKGKAFEKQSFNKKPHAKRDDKKAERQKGKRNKSTNRTPKVMSTGPEKKPENSPFAILEQLKKSSDG